MSDRPPNLARDALEHYLSTAGGAPEGDWALLDNLTADEAREIAQLAIVKLREPIKLGARYRDTATGFEGVATSKWEKWDSVVLWGLERLGTDGNPSESFFIAGRLELVDNGGVGFRG